jgi:hypothetical protein
MSFAARLAQARSAETTVLSGLRDNGWNAEPFGQALLPDSIRDALKRYINLDGSPTLLRWLPDVIASKQFAWFQMIVLLDVKADSGQRFAIELKALETCEALQEHLLIPCWFVWPNGHVLTPQMVRDNCFDGSQFEGRAGSGTPYVLVEKYHARKFKELVTERLTAMKLVTNDAGTYQPTLATDGSMDVASAASKESSRRGTG